MGDRYHLNPTCHYCGHIENEDYYYVPTSGFMTHICEKCGKEIDLENLPGVDAESTASTKYGVKAVKGLK